MTHPNLKALALADHPFDETAVEAAMASLLTNVHRASWTKDRMNAALTAACNSMKERGKARDADSLKSGWDEGGVFLAMQPIPEGAKVNTVTVTIFRHGE